ncbi:uncharacterized protein F23F12.8 [Selaginella moellendorffii]|nr:uncharacterized protein F23F12.8 [Selaginella moellendorffii]|eukprot:XP_002965244.2 uncharacterized protein F23F12.8 [Selaginella moellendorffii]
MPVNMPIHTNILKALEYACKYARFRVFAVGLFAMENADERAREREADERGEEKEGKVVEGEEGQEEEGECPFCLFMKAGPCGKEFQEWEDCVQEAEKESEETVVRCRSITQVLMKCMEGSSYYSVVLQAGEKLDDSADRGGEQPHKQEQRQEDLQQEQVQVQIPEQEQVQVQVQVQIPEEEQVQVQVQVPEEEQVQVQVQIPEQEQVEVQAQGATDETDQAKDQAKDKEEKEQGGFQVHVQVEDRQGMAA